MIQATNITKYFDTVKAVDNVSLDIKEGNVFGMVGTNGAGKSTFLRILSGVLKPDEGECLVDLEPVFENRSAKQKFFYISDDQFYLHNDTPKDLVEFYSYLYPAYDTAKAYELVSKFELPWNRKIETFSKGMKKQMSLIAGICANTKYLLCDETFDGLDPVMRQVIKSIFANEIAERNFTPIIASHNLRELEDICDHVGLLHKGGVLLSKDLEDMRLGIYKIQCVLNQNTDADKLLSQFNIVRKETRGSLYTLTIRDEREKIETIFNKENPLFFEVLPLTLEEIFVCETEGAGYDIKNIIL